VRNDRNKKKERTAAVKMAVLETYELSTELGLVVEKICRAHRDTFPALGQLGKYTMVGRQHSDPPGRYGKPCGHHGDIMDQLYASLWAVNKYIFLLRTAQKEVSLYNKLECPCYKCYFLNDGKPYIEVQQNVSFQL
jgi:hypothetical protein